jgi:4-amino-4-deoxychorismate lyase
MSRLLESIKVQNNKIHAWPYHEQRILRSIKTCYNIDRHALITLSHLQKYVDQLNNKLYKLRLIYDDHSYRIEHHLYKIKDIQSLRLAHNDSISYSEKYVDREQLNNLYSKKGTADDILIIRNGLVTDTWYCNVALLKNGQWYTPKTPLLSGVMRQQLLNQKQIIETDILAQDIKSYTRIRLFNAMIEFGEVELSVDCVIE